MTASKITARVLNTDDLESVRNLIFNDFSLSKKQLPLEIKNTRFENTAKMLSPNDSSTAFGAFMDNQLVGLLSAIRWKSVPYYSLTSLITHNPTHSFVQFKQTHSALFNLILPTFESEKRFTFFYVSYPRGVQLNRVKTSNQLLDTSLFLETTSKYEFVIEEFIPAGERSKFETFHNLVGNVTVDVPIWIRRASLKSEFRNIVSG